MPINIGFFEERRVRRPVSRVLSSPKSRNSQAMDDHSSGTSVTERLVRPTRAAARKHRCRLPGVPPLFGLAPGGVCPAASVTGRAVGSYPTVSPLPGKRTCPAVCFLWHFPWGRPRRPLAGTVSPWSPDFPHPLRSAAIQPSDLRRLTRARLRAGQAGRPAAARSRDRPCRRPGPAGNDAGTPSRSPAAARRAAADSRNAAGRRAGRP